jgi:hypothetical protein
MTISQSLRRPAALVFGIALGLRLVIVLQHIPAFLDDAYITLRVARNLAEGLGPVYNAGDRVQSVTSPLYLLISAGVWKIAGEQTLLILRFASALADALGAVLLFLMVAQRRARAAASSPSPAVLDVVCATFAALFYATLSTTVLMTTGGLETGFYCFAIVAAFSALQRDRTLLAAGAAAAACLLRPDGGLVAAIVFATLWLRQRRIPWRPLLLFGLLVMPYILFAAAYYGSILPQTVTAKSYLERSASAQWQEFLGRFFFGGAQAWAAGAAFAIGAVVSVRERRDLLPLLLFGAAYATVFSSVGMWWPWYLPPVTLPYAVGVGVGLGSITVRLGGSFAQEARLRLLGIAAASAMAVVVTTATLASSARMHKAGQISVTLRREVAEWINANTDPDVTVMLEPLGIFGYFANRRIDDYPGLVSRRVTDALASFGRKIGGNPQDHEALSHIVEAVRPDILVLRQREHDAARAAGALPVYEVVFASSALDGADHFADLQDMVVLARKDRAEAVQLEASVPEQTR